MTQDLIYVNQRNLIGAANTFPDIAEQCQDILGNEWQYFAKSIGRFAGVVSMYFRYGSRTFPIRDQHYYPVQSHIPSDWQNISFSDATDLRFQELSQQFADKTWVICWSGGIDSTVIVASVLKNLPRSKFDQVKIMCNAASVWESPLFYETHIRPNFAVIDSHDYSEASNLIDTHCVIDGEPADSIWGWRFFPNFTDIELSPWRASKDRLLAFLNEQMQCEKTASWFFEKMQLNIDSVDLPISSCYNFHWWINFNTRYIDSMMRNIYRNHNLSLDTVHQNWKHWYDSTAYTKWSLRQHLEQHITSRTYKAEAKRYISEIFPDQYWYNYKTKSSSGSIVIHNNWYAIRSDHTLCYDLDEIMESLPSILSPTITAESG